MNVQARRQLRMRDSVLAPVRRWTPARKLTLLMALRDGVIARGDVLVAHALTEDELTSCEQALARGGADALHAGCAR